ncbi:MAG TPA: hypothetical protein VK255_00525, partial [Patescibacteria group bacterium]|nr:hypothetical protein [Patescibacteria group bacterium]
MKINRKILLTCVFAATIVVGFGLGKVKNAQASTCECGRMGLGSTYYTKIDDQTTKENCKSACETKYGSGQVWSVSFDGQEYTTDTLNSDKSKKNDLVATGNTTDSLCNMSFTKYFSLDVLKCLLLYILKFIGTAIQAATTLFIWVIDTDNMKAVINNSIIYDMWKFVRDMLNVAFILVLLFSAFCTVFQITKYGYKNILLTLIIMALLVNFSFPIARIIIDFSNVIMYFLINGLASDAGLTSTSKSFFVQIANNGGLAQLVKPGSGSAANMGSDLSFLIAAVVFTFIFMVTLVIIAVLLLIRLIVLAVLMIFASVAFVGSIVPFLSKYSSDWWDTLFKQAFFGPVMVFMMVVAFKMMTKLSSYQGKMQNIAAAQSSSEIGNFIAAMAFFSIPIVILWVG